jgi:GxxExxY protein
MDGDSFSEQIIGLAMRVHRRLGPGLLENVYEECLCYELTRHHIPHQRQLAMPILHDDVRLEGGLRIDLLVGGELIVEIKAVEKLLPVHKAQTLTYLRLSGKRWGILLNFNVPLLKDGIRRVVNG